ncbi:MAG: DUF4142 domain-containing protein [Pseudonocardiales bacterium]|nr:DUF4142 domain-containing protein [Pseudonocardiales bacterium]
MMQNAETDLTEIAAGQLAAQRATNPQIRQDAQTIASDHQQVLSKLQDLAATCISRCRTRRTPPSTSKRSSCKRPPARPSTRPLFRP